MPNLELEIEDMTVHPKASVITAVAAGLVVSEILEDRVSWGVRLLASLVATGCVTMLAKLAEDGHQTNVLLERVIRCQSALHTLELERDHVAAEAAEPRAKTRTRTSSINTEAGATDGSGTR